MNENDPKPKEKAIKRIIISLYPSQGWKIEFKGEVVRPEIKMLLRMLKIGYYQYERERYVAAQLVKAEVELTAEKKETNNGQG